jgi:hypothetical protein
MRLKPTHTYEVIASALKGCKPERLSVDRIPKIEADYHAEVRQWERTVRAMAHALQAGNRQFRLDLFFQQSGLNDERG